MEIRNVFRLVLWMAVFASAFISCNSDDHKTWADDVSDTVKSGTWRVGYFTDSGVDKSQNFAGYNFTFGNNTVLTATKEAISHTGVWSVARSTSDSDLFSTIFTIGFGSSDFLGELTGNWKVMENTGTSLKMKDDSKGDTAVEYLTFEKNAE